MPKSSEFSSSSGDEQPTSSARGWRASISSRAFSDPTATSSVTDSPSRSGETIDEDTFVGEFDRPNPKGPPTSDQPLAGAFTPQPSPSSTDNALASFGARLYRTPFTQPLPGLSISSTISRDKTSGKRQAELLAGFGVKLRQPGASTPSFQRPAVFEPTIKSFSKDIPLQVQDRFHDFRTLHSPKLIDLAFSNGKAQNISMKLIYLGETEQTAQLYIVVECDRDIVKKVKQFFAQKHVLEDLGSEFQVDIRSGTLPL